MVSEGEGGGMMIIMAHVCIQHSDTKIILGWAQWGSRRRRLIRSKLNYSLEEGRGHHILFVQ